MRQIQHLNSNDSLSEMLEMRYFCANVTHLRNAEKLTKQQLAQLSGLPPGTIAQIENKKETDKMISVAITLAAVFHVPLEELLWTDLSYMLRIKDRYSVEYGKQLGPKYSYSVANDLEKRLIEQRESGAYNRDANSPGA